MQTLPFLLPQVITGGNDKNAVVFNKETEQIVAVLRGHTKKVTSVVYHPREDLSFTASPDATIRVWGVQKAACAFVLRAHEAAVTGLSLHATGDFLLSASADAHWALSDIRVGRVLVKVADQQKTQGELEAGHKVLGWRSFDYCCYRILEPTIHRTQWIRR